MGGWSRKKTLLALALSFPNFLFKTFPPKHSLNTLKATHLKYLRLKTYVTSHFPPISAAFSASLSEKNFGRSFFQSYYRFFLSIVRAQWSSFCSVRPFLCNWMRKNFQLSHISLLDLFIDIAFHEILLHNIRWHLFASLMLLRWDLDLLDFIEQALLSKELSILVGFRVIRDIFKHNITFNFNKLILWNALWCKL